MVYTAGVAVVVSPRILCVLVEYSTLLSVTDAPYRYLSLVLVFTPHYLCWFRCSDSGEYHCIATPWYLSASTGAWTEAGELTSSRVFLTVRFAGEFNRKLGKEFKPTAFELRFIFVFISSSGSVGVVKAATSLRPRRLAR